jgi:hypothetical protein
MAKFFQIRKLYLQSRVRNVELRPRAIKGSRQRDSSRQPVGQNQVAPHYSFHKLPEPEVSFSPSQEEVIFNKQVVEKKSVSVSQGMAVSTHKTILNNYIDDFFSEPAEEEIQYLEQLPFINYPSHSPAEDEFITVMEENANMVRSIETSRKNISLTR